MKRSCPFVVAAVLGLYGSPAAAGDAQPQLRGKSVTVSWSESREQRNVGQAEFRAVNASHRMSIYVSTSGRVFSRMTNTTRRGTASTAQVEGEGPRSPTGRARVPAFSGRSMTMFLPFTQAGMRRLDVTFDDGFNGCSAKVVYAREQGASTSTAFSPITKRMIEFKSIAASGETCTVSNGNVFGSE